MKDFNWGCLLTLIFMLIFWLGFVAVAYSIWIITASY